MRSVLLVAHAARRTIVTLVNQAIDQLRDSGLEVRMLASEATQCCVGDVTVVESNDQAAAGCEVVLALGGDGTFLRAAELARPAGVARLRARDYAPSARR